jgi:hypothetical protein
MLESPELRCHCQRLDLYRSRSPVIDKAPPKELHSSLLLNAQSWLNLGSNINTGMMERFEIDEPECRCRPYL